MNLSFDLMFMIFPFLFFAMFIAVFALMISQIVMGVRQKRKNDASPILTIPAKIICKRTDVSYHRHHNHNCATNAHDTFSTSSTHYFTTFEVQSGDRIELSMKGSEYGLLVEGDCGELTFQGSRYLGFKRGSINF